MTATATGAGRERRDEAPSPPRQRAPSRARTLGRMADGSSALKRSVRSRVGGAPAGDIPCNVATKHCEDMNGPRQRLQIGCCEALDKVVSGHYLPSMAEDTPTRSGVRMSADERRHDVMMAAVIEFAHTGYAGTSTEQIARRGSVSRSRTCSGSSKTRRPGSGRGRLQSRVRPDRTVLRRGLGGADGEQASRCDGHLLPRVTPVRLTCLLQLHAYAASGDDEIRTSPRGASRAWASIRQDPDRRRRGRARRTLLNGMLLNVPRPSVPSGSRTRARSWRAPSLDEQRHTEPFALENE